LTQKGWEVKIFIAMNAFSLIGKSLILLGGFLLLLGVIILLLSSTGWRWKLLPGDIFIQKDNFTFFFPITTSILLSVFLTALFFLISFLFRR
jgi:heme/copper-type cytochrome/quinol oxidase subunit 2